VTEDALAWGSTVRAGLTPAAVEPAVRRRLGRPRATVTSLEARSVAYTNIAPTERQLWLLSGSARDGGASLPWSLVLKAFRRPTDASSTDDLTAYPYWRREAEFYGSALPSEIRPRLCAVACYGVEERSPDEIWIWLDALTDEHGDTWPAARYNVAAEHLGEFGGLHAVGGFLPSHAWFGDSRKIMTHFSIEHPGISGPVLKALESPPTTSPRGSRALGTPRDRQILLETFRRQSRFLDALDRLPRTLCHNDAMRSNLFAMRSPDESAMTVAIDWALVGLGPVGGDLGGLIPGSAFFFKLPVADLERLERLDRASFEAYCTGLAGAGARIPATDVRLSALTTMLCHWTSVTSIHLVLALDPAEEEWVVRFWNRPPAEVVEHLSALLAFLTRRAAEAQDVFDATR